MPNPTIIIEYANSAEKNERFYREDTFDYNIMFMEVEPHHKKISPGKYNDTITGMSVIYTDRGLSSSEARDEKSFSNNQILPKDILSDKDDEHVEEVEEEEEENSEEGEKMTFYNMIEEKNRRHKYKVLD